MCYGRNSIDTRWKNMGGGLNEINTEYKWLVTYMNGWKQIWKRLSLLWVKADYTYLRTIWLVVVWVDFVATKSKYITSNLYGMLRNPHFLAKKSYFGPSLFIRKVYISYRYCSTSGLFETQLIVAWWCPVALNLLVKTGTVNGSVPNQCKAITWASTGILSCGSHSFFLDRC